MAMHGTSCVLGSPHLKPSKVSHLMCGYAPSPAVCPISVHIKSTCSHDLGRASTVRMLPHILICMPTPHLRAHTTASSPTSAATQRGRRPAGHLPAKGNMTPGHWTGHTYPSEVAELGSKPMACYFGQTPPKGEREIVDGSHARAGPGGALKDRPRVFVAPAALPGHREHLCKPHGAASLPPPEHTDTDGVEDARTLSKGQKMNIKQSNAVTGSMTRWDTQA